MGKTNPLNDADMADFVALQMSFADSANSWSVNRASIEPASCDLSVRNPNARDEVPLRKPETIIEEMMTLDAESAEILSSIRAFL